MAFNSPDGSRDDFFLSNFLNRDIKDEIARVNSVGKVQTFGVGEFSIRIWLDPNKLKSADLSADDVGNAVKEQNRQGAAGQIGERIGQRIGAEREFLAQRDRGILVIYANSEQVHDSW